MSRASAAVSAQAGAPLVEESIRDRFLEAFLAKAKAIKHGDPRDETSDIGPQISRPHFERVKGFVERAVGAGLKPALGGGPNETLGGLYFKPTLFVDPPETSEILREEVFGPVLCLQSFTTEAQAIEMANDSIYGLAASIWTSDVSVAHKAARDIEAGIVWVNCFDHGDMTSIWGGFKQSGMGRDKCLETLTTVTQTKSVWMHIGG